MQSAQCQHVKRESTLAEAIADSFAKISSDRAPDVRVIVQMKEKILGLITNIHYEIQSDFHL